MSVLNISQTDNGVSFGVRVVPGSSRTALCGILGGMLKVKLSTAPEKGKANQALVRFLAEKLKVRKNTVAIVAGHTSTVKQLAVDGVTRDIVVERLCEKSR